MRKEIKWLGVGFTPGVIALGHSFYRELGMQGIALLALILVLIIAPIAALLSLGKPQPLPIVQPHLRHPQ